MFYAMWLVCIMGASQECNEIEKIERVLHKTEEACKEYAANETKQIMLYLMGQGLVAQVGYKCEEDKNSI